MLNTAEALSLCGVLYAVSVGNDALIALKFYNCFLLFNFIITDAVQESMQAADIEKYTA